MIKLFADRAALSVVQSQTLTSGMKDVVTVEFIFSKEWQKLGKVAVFSAGGEAVDVLLDGDTCLLPHEALKKPGAVLKIGVCGVKEGGVVLPTVWCAAGSIEPGASLSENPASPPSPDLLEQMLGVYGEAQELMSSIRADLADGRFDGERGEPGYYLRQIVGAGVTELQMEANVSYECGPVGALALSFGDAPEGYCAEYRIIFEARVGTGIEFPENIHWSPAEPVIEPGHIYEMSFVPLGSKFGGVWCAVPA